MRIISANVSLTPDYQRFELRGMLLLNPDTTESRYSIHSLYPYLFSTLLDLAIKIVNIFLPVARSYFAFTRVLRLITWEKLKSCP